MGFMLVSYKSWLFCGINMSWSVVCVCAFYRSLKVTSCKKISHILSLTVSNLFCHYCHCHRLYYIYHPGKLPSFSNPKSAEINPNHHLYRGRVWSQHNSPSFIDWVCPKMVHLQRWRCANCFTILYIRYMDPTTSFRDCVTGSFNFIPESSATWAGYTPKWLVWNECEYDIVNICQPSNLRKSWKRPISDKSILLFAGFAFRIRSATWWFAAHLHRWSRRYIKRSPAAFCYKEGPHPSRRPPVLTFGVMVMETWGEVRSLDTLGNKPQNPRKWPPKIGRNLTATESLTSEPNTSSMKVEQSIYKYSNHYVQAVMHSSHCQLRQEDPQRKPQLNAILLMQYSCIPCTKNLAKSARINSPKISTGNR